MIPNPFIPAGTDFSIAGNNAVRRAALLARELGGKLHVLHALDDAGPRPLGDWFSPTIDIDLKAAQARAALRRIAVEILGTYDLSATVEVQVGHPLAMLMQASERADLIVLGRHGQGRLGSLLIGSTAGRLLRTSRRPVLVVKKTAATPYRRVLAPVDFTASSDAALRLAAGMAGRARMHVFHAADSHVESMLRRSDVSAAVIREVRRREEAAVDARFRHWVARLGLDGTRMSFSVGRGPADIATLECARVLGTDLIVAGRQRRSVLGEFLLGSVSRRVLAGSDCDVLIVPRARGVSRPHPERVESSAALVEAGGAAHWMQNTPRFLGRRAS